MILENASILKVSILTLTKNLNRFQSLNFQLVYELKWTSSNVL